MHLAASHGLYRGNCLSRSLLLRSLLSREGIDGDLLIGVRSASSRIEAHAWVEYQGVVLNDQPNVRERYRPFDSPVLPAGIKFVGSS